MAKSAKKTTKATKPSATPAEGIDSLTKRIYALEKQVLKIQNDHTAITVDDFNAQVKIWEEKAMESAKELMELYRAQTPAGQNKRLDRVVAIIKRISLPGVPQKMINEL